MTIYRCWRFENGFEIRVGEDAEFGAPLEPRENRQFEWGCLGVGSQHLAFAILAHHLGDDARVMVLCHHFQLRVIGRLPRGEDHLGEIWTLTADEIEKAIQEIETDHAEGLAYERSEAIWLAKTVSRCA